MDVEYAFPSIIVADVLVARYDITNKQSILLLNRHIA